MLFPDWVDNPPSQSDEVRARKRIRFLIRRAAVLTNPECTVGGMCERFGLSHNHVLKCMSTGVFPASLATQIERAVGRDVICHEHLLFPLEINDQ